jgi:hypothetical protein
MESVLPNRESDRTDTPLPKVTISNTDRTLPKRETPYNDNAEPIIAKERKETEEPKEHASKQLKLEPNRTIP